MLGSLKNIIKLSCLLLVIPVCQATADDCICKSNAECTSGVPANQCTWDINAGYCKQNSDSGFATANSGCSTNSQIDCISTCSFIRVLEQCYVQQSCMCEISTGIVDWYKNKYGPAQLSVILGPASYTFLSKSFSPKAALQEYRPSGCQAYTGVTYSLVADSAGGALSSAMAAQLSLNLNNDLIVNLAGAQSQTLNFMLQMKIPLVSGQQIATTIMRVINLRLYQGECATQVYTPPASFSTTYEVSNYSPFIKGLRWDRTNNAGVNYQEVSSVGKGCEVATYKLSSLADSFVEIGSIYPSEATIHENGNYNFEMKTIGSQITAQDAYIWAYLDSTLRYYSVSPKITIQIQATCSSLNTASACNNVAKCSWRLGTSTCTFGSCGGFNNQADCTPSTDCYWLLNTDYNNYNYPHLQTCRPFDSNQCNPIINAKNPSFIKTIMQLPNSSSQVETWTVSTTQSDYFSGPTYSTLSICSTVAPPATYPSTFLFSNQGSGSTALVNNINYINGSTGYNSYSVLVSYSAFLVLKAQNSYDYVAFTYTVNNYCIGSSFNARKLLYQQYVDPQQLYVISGNWEIVGGQTGRCLPYSYKLFLGDGVTAATGFISTKVLVGSDLTQDVHFEWDQITSLGSNGSPVNLVMAMYVDDTDRSVKTQAISVQSFSNANPCTNVQLQSSSATKTNNTVSFEMQTGNYTFSPYLNLGIQFVSADAVNCDVQTVVIINGLITDPTTANAIPYDSNTQAIPNYSMDVPKAYANLLTINWDKGGNDTIQVSIFGKTISYQYSPIIQMNVFNYCNLYIIMTNTTIPVYPLSLTNGFSELKLTDLFSYNMTRNMYCVYYSQNVYSDLAMTQLVKTQISTQQWYLKDNDTFVENLAPEEFNMQINQTTPGTFTNYYYPKLNVVNYAQINNFESLPITFTICGLENIKILNGGQKLNFTRFLNPQSTGTQYEYNFPQLFGLDTTISLSLCEITNYVLCADAACETLFRQPNIWMEKQDSASFNTIERVVYPAQTSSIDFGTPLPSTQIFAGAMSTSSIYSYDLYLGAITRGYVIETVPLHIEIKCGLEVLTLKDQNFIEIRKRINSGTQTILTQAELQFFATTTAIFTSSISLSDCPILQDTITIEKHDPSAYRGTPAQGQNVYSDKFKISDNGKLVLKTDKFKKAGYYYADLTAETIGGAKLQIPFEINIEDEQTAITTLINQPPFFETSIQDMQITVNPASPNQYLTFRSPKILDGEGDKVTIALSGLDENIDTKIGPNYFELSLDQYVFPPAAAKIYKIGVIITDDKSNKKTTVNFKVDIKYKQINDTSASNKTASNNQKKSTNGTETKGGNSTQISPNQTLTNSSNSQSSVSSDTILSSTSSSNSTESTTSNQSTTTTSTPATEEEIAPVVQSSQELSSQIVASTQTSDPVDIPLDTPTATKVTVSTATWQKTASQKQFTAAQVKFLQKIQKELIKRYNEKENQSKTNVKLVIVSKPFEIKPPQMQQDGIVGLQFSEKVHVPDFLTKNDRRRLISLDEINVQRDVLDLNLIINSDVDPDKIKYFLKIVKWDENGFHLLMNVTTPLLISKGIQRDQAQIKIKNPYLFISLETGKPIDTDKLQLTIFLPRMLPKNVSIKTIKVNAQTAGQGMQAFIYGQIVLQIFMKGSMEDMWGAFFSLQILCQLTLYAISIPSNAEIYVEQFRKLIDFDMFKPDNFLPFINPEWNVKYFIGLSEIKLTGALQSSGIKSGNIVYNMATYLFMGFTSIVLFLLLASLMIFKKFKAKIMAKVIQILNKTFFNNLVRSFNISYIKLTASFSIVVHLNMIEDREQQKPFLPILAPVICLGIMPFLAAKVLVFQSQTLETPETKAKIERMYQDIHVIRNQWTIYYYPAFLMRRFLFVVIPIILPIYPVIQLQALIMLNLFFVMYYGGVQPHITFKKRALELFNEYMILLISLQMLLFTNFIHNDLVKFYIGYIFTSCMALVFVVNIGVMLHNNILKLRLKQMKKKSQKMYETRFKERTALLQKIKEDRKKVIEVQKIKRLAFYMNLKFDREYSQIGYVGPKPKTPRNKKIPQKLDLETELSRISEKVGEEDTVKDEETSEDLGDLNLFQKELLDKTQIFKMPPIQKAKTIMSKLEDNDLDKAFQKIIKETMDEEIAAFPQYCLDKNENALVSFEQSSLAKAKSFIMERTNQMSILSLSPLLNSKSLQKEELQKQKKDVNVENNDFIAPVIAAIGMNKVAEQVINGESKLSNLNMLAAIHKNMINNEDGSSSSRDYSNSYIDHEDQINQAVNVGVVFDQ